MFTFPITFLTEAASVFLPADPPGAPFADYNAQSLSAGNVTTWANEGSDATGDVTTFGTSNAPECIDDGTGPVPGAKYVRFDRANSEALQGTFTTTRASGARFAMVARVNSAAPPGTFYWFDGAVTTNRMALYYSSTAYSMFSGGATSSGTIPEKERWVRIIGEYGVDGRLVVERATRIDANTSTHTLTGLTLGARFSEANYGPVSIARLTWWDDGTSLEAIERWLEAAYPFAAVPPGNPDIWLDPNDQPIGSISAITDKGSRGVDPTTVADMSIVADTDCPEQQVFSFNGTTSAIRWAGGSFTSIDLSTTNALFATCARSTQDSVQDAIFGDNGAPTWYCRYANTNAMVRNFGSAQTGDDFDTLAPFNTRLRWANVQFLEVAGASGGGTYIDGNLSATSSAGTNNLASMSIGVQGISWFTGRMADILVYVGANEANAQRAAEVEQWLQRHRRLSTRPGTPYTSLDAETEVGTIAADDPVSTWTNTGAAANYTNTGGLRPIFRVTDGPEPGAGSNPSHVAHVQFRSANLEHLDENATRADETQPNTVAFVFRMDALPGTAVTHTLIHSQTGTSANAINIIGSAPGAFPRINAGTDLDDSDPYLKAGEWYAGAAEFNSTASHLWWTNSGTTTGVSGDAGTEGQAEGRLARNAGGSGYPDASLARVEKWSDGTTFEQAQEWVKRRYPNVNSFGTGR